MKMIAIIIVLILVVVAGVLIFSPKAPSNVQSLQVGENATTTSEQTQTKDDNNTSKIELTDFSFVGYGPGKSHVGKFEQYEVKDVHFSANGIPVGGEIVIQTSSITTDTEMLTQHLCEKENFFNCAMYPTISFKLSNVTATGAGVYQVSGDLKVKDVSKNVSFAVTATADKTFSTEFKLKMSDFGFSAPGIVDDEVLIKFAGKII